MDILKFFQEANKLKRIRRTGWVIDKVKNPESAADHTFMVTLLTLILGAGRKDIDINKALRMAIVHDLMECACGDLVLPYEKYRKIPNKKSVTEHEKKELEEKAMKKVTSMLGKDGKTYLELWNEVEKRETKEAEFVYQIDKLELALQALEYENEGNFSNKYGNLEHYFLFAKDIVKDQSLVKILNKILSMRKIK